MMAVFYDININTESCNRYNWNNFISLFLLVTICLGFVNDHIYLFEGETKELTESKKKEKEEKKLLLPFFDNISLGAIYETEDNALQYISKRMSSIYLEIHTPPPEISL